MLTNGLRVACILTMKRLATAVTITDPLVKYNALLATGACSPDPAQHRLAIHLQKLYFRLKDYQPPTEYRTRLRQLSQVIDCARENETKQLAVRSHPIRRNPIFAKVFRSIEGPEESRALTRILTSHQGALDVESPKGLFLSGDVGTGKSMLLDLLADGLPTSRKKRWHFNTFMLHTTSRLEQFRKSEIVQADREWSLLWMAKELIEQSPILFLDEFQLPDRASSKILSNLFIPFFHLGGVLVASSNRMPDELEKATGPYPAPPTGGLVRQLFGAGTPKPQGELFGNTSDFAAFLEVLQARCDFWHMEGIKDWRRRDFTEHAGVPESSLEESMGPEESDMANEVFLLKDAVGDSTTPQKYALTVDDKRVWDQMVLKTIGNPLISSVPWSASNRVVYGRAIRIPRQHNGVAFWNFDELVHTFGPADYITLASNFHTFIIDKVPVLPVSMKNEARRFITLLDALYEARCKVLIRAEVGPDNLFFPEQSRRRSANVAVPNRTITGENEDATYSETVSEVFQDAAAPFRPNISSYNDGSSTSSGARASTIHAEIDSDFGILGQKVDFVNTLAFTGEDERFAYKRAASRLWEMCSCQWHARPGPPENWWIPLPIEARHWEGREASRPLGREYAFRGDRETGDVAWGPSVDLDEPAGLAKGRVEDLEKDAQD